jgi:hypothetical protein
MLNVKRSSTISHPFARKPLENFRAPKEKPSARRKAAKGLGR